MSSVVRVQFSRAGEREGVPLRTSTKYQVRINGGPIGTFRAPLDEAQLEAKIQILRNKSHTSPTSKVLNEIGQGLGTALYGIPGLEAGLAPRGSVLELLLDYPELARIPWELATRNIFPYQHLLMDGVSIVRNVPSLVQDQDAQWPTGRNRALELLFVWTQREDRPVPHEEHRAALQQVCNRYGVDLVCRELKNIAELAALFSASPPVHYHFVHVLAHGTLTDGDWGLSFADGAVKGKQLAEALRAGDKTPALVTLSACDSAGEPNNSFGSPAYQLHVHGIPFVVASQFRLRESSSIESTKRIYGDLLGGGHLRDLLSGIRAQLAVADNEAWANEIVYTRYRFEALDDLAMVARQQAVLRRANAIERRAGEATETERVEMIRALDAETDRLGNLMAEQRERGAPNGAIAETCGLMGSMQRRKARLGVKLGDEAKADLLHACHQYLAGLRADLNSHFCGINAVHLLLRLGDRKGARKLIPMVRLAAESQIASGTDFWAHATAGELEVYERKRRAAERHYANFVQAVEQEVRGKLAIASTLNAALRQLQENEEVFRDDVALCQAASAARQIVDRGIQRARGVIKRAEDAG